MPGGPDGNGVTSRCSMSPNFDDVSRVWISAWVATAKDDPSIAKDLNEDAGPRMLDSRSGIMGRKCVKCSRDNDDSKIAD